VDIIIGGHSHTVLEQPGFVNGILITQAGQGTDNIGRFDLEIDTLTNSIASWKWELVPINDATCPRDEDLEQMVAGYKSQTDAKYNAMLCRLPRAFTHPDRYQETELGDLFSDALAEQLGVDLAMFGSGSIRQESMGPVVTLGTLMEVAPYVNKLIQLQVSGAQLKTMWRYILREEAFIGGHTEFFQVSGALSLTWSRSKQEFERFDFNGAPLANDTIVKVAVQDFHRDNCDTSLGVPLDSILANGPEAVLATSDQDVLIEYLSTHSPRHAAAGGRLVVVA
jgi:5'-nucleotidase